MTDLITTTKAEDELIMKLMRDNKEMNVSIPDDMGPAEIRAAIKSCCSMIFKLNRTSGKVKPVLGRLMVLARRNPEVYEKLGYASFEEYSAKEIQEKYGIGRSNSWEGKRIIEHYPNLPIAQYGKIGIQNMLLLCKFSSQQDAGHKKLLAKAEEMTHDKFKTWVEDNGYLGHGETSGATISISGNKSEIKTLRKWLERPEIQAHVGSAEPIAILLAATEELEEEWVRKGEKALEKQEKAAEKEAGAAA